MRIHIAASAVLLSLPLVAAGDARAAEPAAAKCSEATLRGTYVFAYSGVTLEGKGKGPFATAGQETYDGDGHVSGVSTTSINGKIAKLTKVTGKYTIRGDCTGSVSYSDGSTYDQFTDPDGETVAFVQTNAGTVAAAVEQRVRAR